MRLNSLQLHSILDEQQQVATDNAVRSLVDAIVVRCPSFRNPQYKSYRFFAALVTIKPDSVSPQVELLRPGGRRGLRLGERYIFLHFASAYFKVPEERNELDASAAAKQ